MSEQDLFGTLRPKTATRVRLYADEIKPYRNDLDEQWMYIGILAIPEDRHQDALGSMMRDRKQANYPREVHFIELRNRSDANVHNEKTLLAKYWTEHVVHDVRKTFHFHLLGLSLDHLQNLAFGTAREQRRNIYNRFFRASVKGMLKYFFGDQVTVTNLFHDQENFLEQADLFDWHAIWRIEQEAFEITFLTSNVVFVDSDHRKEQGHPAGSHFVQLCDVLLGGLTQYLDATTTKDGCCEIAEVLLPLAERLVDPQQARNPHTRYSHMRRVSMSFFPSKTLSQKELEDPYLRAQSGFHITRRLLFKEKRSGQLPWL